MERFDSKLLPSLVLAQGPLKSPVVNVSPADDGSDSSDEFNPYIGLYDRPLPCCGCGLGWFSFLVGFIFPLAWFYGTLLYLMGYYHYEPRERSGLAACAIAALICAIAVFTITSVLLSKH